MYPIPAQNDPAARGGYVPYFYHSGLHYAYPMTTSTAPLHEENSRGAVYEFSRMDASLWSDSHPQTVEEIIQRGYFAVPNADPVTAMISDKGHTSRLGLDDVISQVRHRYVMYEQNLHEIELAKCAATNAIYQHEAYCGPASASSKQHYAKHKAIQDLYAEARLERANLWKDISRLKLQLPESAQLYLSAHRKMAVLASTVGDEP